MLPRILAISLTVTATLAGGLAEPVEPGQIRVIDGDTTNSRMSA
jgi:hypothetical protein